jgi:hypothetical protein
MMNGSVSSRRRRAFAASRRWLPSGVSRLGQQPDQGPLRSRHVLLGREEQTKGHERPARAASAAATVTARQTTTRSSAELRNEEGHRKKQPTAIIAARAGRSRQRAIAPPARPATREAVAVVANEMPGSGEVQSQGRY